MTLNKIHLEDSINRQSLSLPVEMRRNLIRYLTHVPITPDMNTTQYMFYQVKILQNFGFTPETMNINNQDFNNFCGVLRNHYDFVTQGKFYK